MLPQRSRALAAMLALACTLVPARAATVRIIVENLEFSPKTAAAKVGDTIEWINKDAFAHSASAHDGAFDVELAPGKTGRVVVKKAGEVAYYCRYHPNMTATLEVAP